MAIPTVAIQLIIWCVFIIQLSAQIDTKSRKSAEKNTNKETTNGSPGLENRPETTQCSAECSTKMNEDATRDNLPNDDDEEATTRAISNEDESKSPHKSVVVKIILNDDYDNLSSDDDFVIQKSRKSVNCHQREEISKDSFGNNQANDHDDYDNISSEDDGNYISMKNS